MPGFKFNPRFLPWLDPAYEAYKWYRAATDPVPWELGAQSGEWKLHKICEAAGAIVAWGAFGASATPGITDSCLVNQAGYWDGVSPYSPPVFTPNNFGNYIQYGFVQFVPANNPARVTQRYNWRRTSTNQKTNPNPVPGPFAAPGSSATKPMDDPLPEPGNAPWEFSIVPTWVKPGNVTATKPQPVYNPQPRPEWPSPEFPDVGPQPEPKTEPKPDPKTDPEPTVIIDISPGTTTTPGVIDPPGKPDKPVRRPPRGTKERKARVGALFGIIWRGIGTVTEGLDFLNNLYEALDWKLKRDWYNQHGRQPTPQEKLQIIYKNINNLDIVKALQNYTKDQIEDMIYAAGGKKAAEANTLLNRPIGIEAGGGLTGGGGPIEFADGGFPDTAPDWFPTDWVPW